MDVTDSEKPQTNGEADMLPEKLLEQKIETFRDLPASTKTLTQLPSAPTDFGSGSGGKCHPLQELQACQTPSKNENRKWTSTYDPVVGLKKPPPQKTQPNKIRLCDLKST